MVLWYLKNYEKGETAALMEKAVVKALKAAHFMTGKASTEAEIKRLSDELKQARKELEYCVDIAERSARIQQSLIDLRADREDLERGQRNSGFSRQLLWDDYER